jgi:hypothetical protein
LPTAPIISRIGVVAISIFLHDALRLPLRIRSEAAAGSKQPHDQQQHDGADR